jgi:hypothetical protein
LCAAAVSYRGLAIIDEARGWTTIHRELAEINDLNLEELIGRGPASYRVFAKLDRKMDEIRGKPTWKKIKAEQVTFEMMIPKWATHTNAPKKGIADMRSTAKRFAKWLGRAVHSACSRSVKILFVRFF